MKPTRLIAVLLCSAVLPCAAAMAQDTTPASVAQEAAPVAEAGDVTAAPPPASTKFEVERSGDEELSCDALTTEITALNAQMVQIIDGVPAEAEAQPRRRALGSMLSLGGGIAAALIPGAGLAIGAAQMLSTADEAGGLYGNIQNIFGQGDAGAVRALTKRVEHLTALSEAKSC